MLPKPEKLKKISTSSDTPNPSDPAILAKKIKNKRRLVIITLIITVGCSLIFWGYRFFKNVFQSPPSFNFHLNLPKFKNNQNIKTNSIESDVKKIISPSADSWSIYIGSLSPVVFSWEQNSAPIFSGQNLDSLKNKIMATLPVSQSQFSQNLPQGIIVRELVSESPDFNYQTIISTPSQQIIFLIKVTSPTDINKIKNIVPQLIDKIYWDIVKISLN